MITLVFLPNRVFCVLPRHSPKPLKFYEIFVKAFCTLVSALGSPAESGMEGSGPCGLFPLSPAVHVFEPLH